MAGTRQELETAVFHMAASVATVRAALSAAITNDEDKADRLDVLEGCYRVLGNAMDSMWTTWEQFDQGERGGPEAQGRDRAGVGSSMRCGIGGRWRGPRISRGPPVKRVPLPLYRSRFSRRNEPGLPLHIFSLIVRPAS